MSVNSHLNAVIFSEAFNEQYEKTLPIISNYYSEIGANKPLYMAIKGLHNVNLNNQQKHIVKETIRGFELSGVGLEGKASERYKAIKEQLSILSNQFSKNVLQATNSWKKIVSLDDLKGYGKDELLKIKDSDQYVLNLQIPVYIDLMTYAENILPQHRPNINKYRTDANILLGWTASLRDPSDFLSSPPAPYRNS